MSQPSLFPKQNIHDSFLTTRDPYHIPGYNGYCPQFKYRIGHTFAAATSDLLADGEVSSSGRLVLANKLPVNKKMEGIIQNQMDLVRTRKASWGNQKLVESMVPGYTGFVPKSQNYFGKRYAENCLNAVSDFEGNQRENNQRIAELKLNDAIATGVCERKHFQDLQLPDVTNRYTTPLEPVADTLNHYVDRSTPRLPISPYNMQQANPDKHFMSGYTGYVPRARFLNGYGYPVITHNALNEFADDGERHKMTASAPVQIQRDEKVVVNSKPIYPNRSGLIPNYKGHVPGELFRFGRTFGFSTVDSMNRGPYPKPKFSYIC